MDNIQDAFRKGVEGYTPATMWFTSGNINKKEMTYQIEGFDRQGIKDYFIHPSSDTRGDYLGDHFFRMIKHAAAEAKRLGMHYWIYDEYNWPSGVAGGQVLEDEPWTRASRLFKLTQTAVAGETIRFDLPDKKIFNTIPLLFIVDGKEVKVTMYNDTVIWSNTTDEEKTLEIYVVKWLTGKNSALSGSEVVAPTAEGYLDVLDPEAVEVFIQKTHEVYKKHVGEGFGDYVKGVFTDEVVILYDTRRREEAGLPVLPWTRRFLEKFEERNGYDIRPRLHELMSNTDPKLNIDYWETITELFMNAFAQMTYDWCTKNKLIYTGHIDAEECIGCAVYRSGDPYEYYKRFTWPGIDTIYTYYRINDYSYNITAKLATSAAHFHNKERILSETFTISGWDIRLRDMKRIFNRLAVLGINFLQFMGSRYNFIPGHDSIAMTNNWQNPLFKHYNEYSKYVSGIQYLVANTSYDAHTLLFYPMTTVRATITPMPINAYQGDMNFTIIGLVNSLLNLNISFEFGFEQVIEGSEVENGKLKFAGSEYGVVILPSTTYLKEETFLKLKEFAATGGRIIAVNGKPEKIIGEQVYDAPDFENAVVYDCYNYEMSGKFAGGFDTYQKAPMGQFTECLKNALAGIPASIADLEPCNGIMSAIRKDDDAYYVIIINDNDAITPARGEILLDKPFRVLNTETGDIRPMKTAGKSFEIMLAPFECVVIEISDSVENTFCDICSCNKEEIQLKNITFAPAELNTALPTMWQVRGKAAEDIINARRVYNPKRVCDLANALSDEDIVICRGNTAGGMPVKAKRDWFGWHAIDKKPIAPGETVVCIYDFTIDTMPETLEIISDPNIDTVWFLNEEQLYQSSTRRVWHYANPVYDISDIAVPGKNRLVAICTFPEYKGDFALPCAVLKCDARVFDDFVITQKPGGNELNYWNDQGYTFYTGDGVYSAEFTAPKSGRVVLELATTDVAEVYVNGTCIGKRLWDPYKFDLTGALSDGINKLEIRVTSTLSNFIYNRNLSGLKTTKLYVMN